MVRALALLLVFQLAGEAVVRALGVALPGPVLGLAFLVAFFASAGPPSDETAKVADGLLAHLSLLFVPAGVGVVQHLPRLMADGVAIGVALVGSTVATLVVAALVFVRVARWTAGRETRP